MPHTDYTANGLRELADWIETHPDIPVPDPNIVVYSLNSKEEAAALVRDLKPCRKEYDQ